MRAVGPSERGNMGVREGLNAKPITGVAVAVLGLMLGGWAIFRQMHPSEVVVENRVFFSDDDGKTWFADSPTRIPPFQHDGKEAVRCFVFQADGGQPFAGYLRKYTPYLAGRMRNNAPCSDAELLNGTLVKRPGDPNWISTGDPRSAQVMQPKVRNNPGAQLTMVQP